MVFPKAKKKPPARTGDNDLLVIFLCIQSIYDIDICVYIHLIPQTYLYLYLKYSILIYMLYVWYNIYVSKFYMPGLMVSSLFRFDR